MEEEEEVENARDLQVLGVRRWRELVADGKNGRTLFDRPKPTVCCSATGRRRRSGKYIEVEVSVPSNNQQTNQTTAI